MGRARSSATRSQLPSNSGSRTRASTAGEVLRRYPQLRLRGDETAYYEPGAGFLRPEACVGAQLAEARRLGAEVFPSEVVLEITAGIDSVEVRTDQANYSAAKVVVAVGPWIQKLMGAEYSRLFKIYRQVMNWFALARNPERYAPERFPIFIWLTGSEPRDMMYGFPAIDGPTGGVKISTEQYLATVDPDMVSQTVSAAEVQAMYAEYIQPRFADVSGTCLRSQTCLYTVTPDAKFIVDRSQNSENILFASACSGHGFKHSAAIGEALVAMALGSATCGRSFALSPEPIWRSKARSIGRNSRRLAAMTAPPAGQSSISSTSMGNGARRMPANVRRRKSEL